MRNMRNPCPSARIGVDGETTYEAYETYETLVRLMRHMEASEGNKTATPLRLSIFSGLSWENSILDYQSSIHMATSLQYSRLFWDWIA